MAMSSRGPAKARKWRLAAAPTALCAIITGVLLPMPTGAAPPGERIVYAFRGGTDGSDPAGGLILGRNGVLYGTTFFGGGTGCLDNAGCGTVFALRPTHGDRYAEQILYTFKGGADGSNPAASLLSDRSGALYGTTNYGGGASCDAGGQTVGCGTAFRLSPTRSGAFEESVLYAFVGGMDGADPGAGLTEDAKGVLYGATQFGGSQTGFNCSGGCGTVYALTPVASGYQERQLYAFTGTPDGSTPVAPLLLDAGGTLYGTTYAGGGDYGTVFTLTPAASGGFFENIIHDFTLPGWWPMGGLIAGRGAFYGTTSDAPGTVYRLTLGPSGYNLTTLYAMGTQRDDGYLIESGVVADRQGALYATTLEGGIIQHRCSSNCGYGTVFEVAPQKGGSYAEIVLHRFHPTRAVADGQRPSAGVVLDDGGHIFGTTTGGGLGHGTVFEIVP